MRADTERKDEMGRRFAIVIGVAAAGVMALGAQTATAGGEPVDSTPPDLQLWGKKKQKIGFADRHTWKGSFPNGHCRGFRRECRQGVAVNASCGGEACTLRVEGKLTNVKNYRLRPGCSVERCELWEEPELKSDVGLTLSGRTHKKAYRAIDNGKNVQAKVTVEATDAAGNVATAKRTVKLVN